MAKGWEWNDDFTEVTFFLRKGHKWSDGEPFTAADVEFWMNEIILNPDVYPETPGWATFGDGTMTAEAIDDATVKFTLPTPTPGILSFFATTYIQPFQPKHFFDQAMEETGMSLGENEENGGYSVALGNAVGQTIFSAMRCCASAT